MSDKTRNMIAIIVVALFAVIVICYGLLSGRYNRLPDDAVGNTAGNLNNYGLFCETEGTIFFANPYDNYALYKMTSTGENLVKLNDLAVKYINAGGKYVFFYGDTSSTTSGLGGIVAKPGMYQLTWEGKKLKALTKDVSQNMLLLGNTLYYQHYREKEGTTFAAIDISKKESTELLDFMVNPSCYDNGLFYYNGLYSDHYLYTYDIATGEVNCLWENQVWNPIYSNGYVYYIDMMNNYRLCRYSFSTDTIEVLTNDRLDFYNLYGNIIYYQQSSSKNPCLKRMQLDGSNNEVVAQGIFSSVNITSNYTFFTAYDGGCPLYYTPTFGAIDVTEFAPAKEIVLKKKK